MLLGGHVTLDDRVFLSGNCVVHQFVRVGTLALMQGGSAISKDLPPYTVARGDNDICGLNTVGLRRAGLTPAERLELKQLYRALFREGRNLRAAVAERADEIHERARQSDAGVRGRFQARRLFRRRAAIRARFEL